MATTRTADSGAPEKATATAQTVSHPPTRVRVADTDTGAIQPYPVPRAWLDGRFPNLKEVPSSKAGK